MAIVRGYRPALDGIRAIAIIEVMAFHFQSRVFRGGEIGVDMFFALSGYLITGLLLAERLDRGKVSLRDFYLRRFFRLVPGLLLLVTVGGTVVGFVLPGNRDHALFYGGIIAALYLTDIASYTHDTLWATYVWTWTLSLEEQFYLVWPTLLRKGSASMKQARMLAFGMVAVTLVLAEVFARNGVGGHVPLDYYQPQAHAFCLMLGCAASMVSAPRWFRHLTVPALLGMLALGQFSPVLPTATFLRVNVPLTAVVTVVLLLGLEHTPRIATGVLGWRPLVRIGAISYGLYLFHPVVFIVLGQEVHWAHWVIVVAAFIVTWLVAELSYRFWEAPIRRRGREWLAGRKSAAAAVAT